MWDDDEPLNGTNITVDPAIVTLSNDQDTEIITISNMEIPVKEPGRWERMPKKLVIVAKGKMCLDDEHECNVTTSTTLKRSLLIEVTIYVERDQEILRLFMKSTPIDLKYITTI